MYRYVINKCGYLLPWEHLYLAPEIVLGAFRSVINSWWKEERVEGMIAEMSVEYKKMGYKNQCKNVRTSEMKVIFVPVILWPRYDVHE